MQVNYAQAELTLPSPVGRHIRLLTIHPSSDHDAAIKCSLTIHDLNSKPKYEALSYTWGKQDQRYPVSIGDRWFPAGRNLFVALRHLRKAHELRIMWIDAVCIDQTNIKEREETVAFMGEIYASASGGVVVWLGEEGPDTHHVAPFLDRLIDGFNRMEAAESKWSAKLLRTKHTATFYGGPGLDDPGWKALYNMLLTPWSSRVWVVQEVAKAPREPEIRVLRGSHVFTMERIALAMSTIYKYNLQQEVQLTYPARFATLWGERIHQKDKPGLLEVVKRNWLTYASDERDNIYALLGVGHDIKMPLKYGKEKTADSVFVDFARAVIQQNRSLEIIGALASVPDNDRREDDRLRRSSNLPSWVPDLRVWVPHTFIIMSPEADYEGRNLLHFTAAKGESTKFGPAFLGPENSWLQVEGQIIDTIDSMLGTGPVMQKACSINEGLEFYRKSEYTAGVEKEYEIIGAKQRNYGPAIVKINANKIYEHTGESLLEAFYATLTMDDLHHRHTPHRLDKSERMRRRRLRKIYWNFHQLTHILRESDMGMFHRPSSMLPQFDQQAAKAVFQHYVTEAMSACVNRRLARTREKGYLGIFTNQVYEGNSVVLLKGARVPVIMRKWYSPGVSDEVWQIVGDGYVHGIMDGKAWDPTKCRKFTVV